MKKISVIIASLLVLFSFSLNAQAPYKHSIGGTVGTMAAFSYKTFPIDNFAIDLNAGYKWTAGAVQAGTLFPNTVEINPNFEFELPTKHGGLHWLVGGGISMGYCWHVAGINQDWSKGIYASSSLGKFGVNAIAGIEYKFDVPLTLQVDFRPGYGMLFNNYSLSYFDWALCLGIRYVFH